MTKTIEFLLRWLARTGLLLLLAGALTGCGPDDEGDDPKPDSDSKPNSEENGGETEGNGGTGTTLKAAPVMATLPGFQFVDETGADFGSEQLSGKLWVANFIFTTCQGTCPEQTSWMRRLQERLKTESIRSGIRLVSITVDPETDTPEVLAKYGVDYKAEPGLWKFLTGDREKIWSLAKDGFRLPVQENPNDKQMPILHDSKFVVVDRSGQIRAYIDVLAEGGIDNLLKTIAMVVPEHDPDEGSWDVEGESVTHLAQPPDILDLEWLQGRDQAQAAALEKADVYHNFRFTDRRDESGITFKNQIVDEQRWRLQVNHYDHGNGICAADVDGDGLIDLYFVNQAGRNELWRNLGGGHFEDITEKTGLAVPDRISISAAFADTDNDGDSDVFVMTVRGGNLFFVNDGQGKFTDQTEAAGLNYSGHSSAPVFFDYNRDGKLDLFVSNVGKYTTDEAIPVRKDRFTRLPQPEVKYYPGIKDAFGGHLKPELSERSLL
ncbi:MAG: SCO family protein, partial [Planctomycetes bacterium]|nr:SCO family protein [Planctomycetota bacterium]